jgi:hypothetical protein
MRIKTVAKRTGTSSFNLFKRVSVLQVFGLIVLFVAVIGIMLGIMYSWDSEKGRHIVQDDILKKPAQERGFGSPKKRIGIANMMKNPVDLPLWLKYHRNLGISKFFIRLEDSPSWEEYLKDMDDVYMEVGASDESGNNYTTVIDRQVSFVNSILRDTQKTRDLDWLIHIDGDELIHGDIDSLLRLSGDIKTVKFINAEAIFKEPEKRDSCFSATNFLRCDQGAPCKSYVNGKAAVEPTIPTSI